MSDLNTIQVSLTLIEWEAILSNLRKASVQFELATDIKAAGLNYLHDIIYKQIYD